MPTHTAVLRPQQRMRLVALGRVIVAAGVLLLVTVLAELTLAAVRSRGEEHRGYVAFSAMPDHVVGFVRQMQAQAGDMGFR